jgi:hypothetical protein
MISFRYHLVSIVAVFLALAVGVLVGTTVLDQGIVNRLQDQTRDLSREAAQLRERVDQLQGKASRYDEFISDLLPGLITGELAGRRVVVVTHEGVDPTVLAEAEAALEAGGAEVVGRFAMTPRLASKDVTTRQELAELLGVSLSTTDALTSQAALAVADRLAAGAPLGDDQDVLADLLFRGFLTSEGGSSDLRDVGGPGQAVLVVASSPGRPTVNPGAFSVPLVEELVRIGAPVAAVEGTDSAFRFVEVVRLDSQVAGSDDLVTVDDVDEAIGRYSLVRGLAELISTGRGGHYGGKDGTTAVAPEP